MARTDPRPHYGRGRRVRSDGYVDLWDPSHPIARSDGYVAEHRRIAYELGLLTDPCDEVHHVNGDRTDNRAENLLVLSGDAHARLHAAESGHVSNQYGTWPLRPARPPRADRQCEGCDATVPASGRTDRRFCTGNCRVRTFKRRRRAAPRPS